MRAQMTTKIHGVGPNGDRWDGIDVSGEWYMGRGWVKPRPGEEARVWPGNTCPEISGLESGPAVRTGPLGSEEDWRNEHPDRVNWLLISIKGAFIPDGPIGVSRQLCGSIRVCVYYIFSFLTAIVEMSSPCFLRSISEKDYDRLYDLPTGIHDVMGLQALRPSSAVCKVMSVPDSNCVRVITPDEHVPTGFHEILIEDMGLREWPKVSMSELGCLRLDWPQEFFTFVGRYQLEIGNRCARSAGIDLKASRQVHVRHVRNSFRLIWVGMLLCFTLIWHNYGVARSGGALSGRVRLRTV